ncbi:NAD(P)H-binding protein [Nocardia sp. BSTN01]|uniref:SDR family oxidoreductase n=1 Tax=Nocardia sp. BSTN01 TaxID=2783665 RepID=UPI00188F7702|nr:NAD(P)H-binding protein [Nocardia sp. BSTN01]MBF5001529.1 NAD(P)H-binding protein [Nocardia sp. BSTN01]
MTAATGHVGGHTVRELLRSGHKVRAMGRDHVRLKELEAAGADLFIGDLHDEEYLERAFTGVHGAMLIVPPHPAATDFLQYQIDIARGYATAARKARLRHVVVVSVMGANDNRAGGLIEGHANVEAQLNAVSGLNITHLHPTSFFEILYYFLEPLREEAILRTPLGPDAQLGLVAARDVGIAGAEILSGLQFRGISSFALPPVRKITLREVSGLISAYIGRRISVEQISAEADIEDLIAAGTGRSFATLLNETWALTTVMGQMPPTDPAPSTTARYRIEDFIRDELVPAVLDTGPISDYSTAIRPRRAG